MRIVHRLQLMAYLAASGLLRALPLSIAQGLASVIARAAFAANTRRARWAMANLRLAFPEMTEEKRRDIARASYVTFAWNVIDFARAERWSDEQIMEHCEVVGVENVEEALSHGKGALLLTLHLGSWELGVQAIAIALSRFSPSVVGRPLNNPLIYERIVRTRSRAGATLIDRRKAAAQILRALRKNRPVGILNDQYSRRSRGVFVPLFGARCSTSAGIATLGPE